MSILEILSLLVIIVAVPLNWLVTLLLWRLSNANRPIRVLRERAVAALALSLIVTMFALVFANNDMHPPILDYESTKFVTRGVLLTMAVVPALYWLNLWRKSRL